jgi:myo-inositol 2-dehydrogenase/D-chiro-inositol 1-dehydrogenase
MIGQDHIRRLTRTVAGAEVVAVADIDADRAVMVAKQLSDARVCDTGQDVIAADRVDAVIVTSWGPTHEEYVLAAIGAGKPVFCEKPLAPTPEACRRIVDAEIGGGRRLVRVGFMRRYDPGYQEMKAALTAGALGAPLLVHCVHRNPSVSAGHTSDMAITDTAVHEIDAMRWLLADEIVSAQVRLPRRTSRVKPDVQDPQLLLLETTRGVLVDVEIFVTCGYGYDVQCELVAETGVMRLSDPAASAMRIDGRASVPVTQHWRDRFATAYDTEFVEWVGSVSGDGPAGPSAWDGYAAAVVSDSCLEAQRTGQIITVPVVDRPDFYI